MCDANPGIVSIRNSVIVGPKLPSIKCATATVATSAIDQPEFGGDTNLVITYDLFTEYFEAVENALYRPRSGTVLEGVAQWLNGDPEADFAGTVRPNIDGALDWPGALLPSDDLFVDDFE